MPAKEVVTDAHVEALKQLVQERVAAQEEEFTRRKADMELVSDAPIKATTEAANAEAEPLRKKIEEERTAVKTEFNERLQGARGPQGPGGHAQRASRRRQGSPAHGRRVQAPRRQVRQRLQAAMGADALLNILNRVDIEKMRTKLQLEMQSTPVRSASGHQAPACRRGAAQV